MSFGVEESLSNKVYLIKMYFYGGKDKHKNKLPNIFLKEEEKSC